jgi:WD40 repeat protein
LAWVVSLVLVALLIGQANRPESPSDHERTDRCLTVLNGPRSPVFALSWSPDGRRLAASGFGPTTRIWDRETGAFRQVVEETSRPRFVLGWSDDGGSLLLGGLSDPLESQKWDQPDNVSVKAAPLTDRAESVRAIARAARGTPIRVRDASATSRSRWLPDSETGIVSAAFAPDGSTVVTAELDQTARLWDARTGQLRATLQADHRGVGCVAFSSDGTKVATGGGGPVKLWDASSGALLKTLGQTQGGSAIIGFSPDGRSVADARWDGSIRIWDVATGVQRARLTGHDGQVLALAWSPDGNTIASGGFDSTIRLWDVALPVALARAD